MLNFAVAVAVAVAVARSLPLLANSLVIAERSVVKESTTVYLTFAVGRCLVFIYLPMPTLSPARQIATLLNPLGLERRSPTRSSTRNSSTYTRTCS